MVIRLFERNKTSTIIVMYSFYLYFLVSLRNTSKVLESFKDEKRSHVTVCNWIQRFGSSHIFNKYRRIAGFIIDETMIQIADHRFSASNSIKSASINSLSLGLSFSGTLTLMWTSSSPRPWLWFIPSPLSRSTVPL